MVLDTVRLVATAEGRSRLWTRLVHRNDLHQTTSFTAEDRYPELFDLTSKLMPDARRILSFGCSTGEELLALRRRFPSAEIVGAEINPRSRRLARKRVAGRAGLSVKRTPDGSFDLIFALAVLQREPHKIAEMEVENLSFFYSFSKFDQAVRGLVARLRPGGLLCVTNCQYRVEDTSVANELRGVSDSALTQGDVFAPDGRRAERANGRTLFTRIVQDTGRVL